MAFLDVNTNFTGEVGVRPARKHIRTNDSVADITTVNYLSPLLEQGYQFLDGDIAFITHGDDSNITTCFCVQYSGANVYLIPTSSEVTLPVTDGNIVEFDGTTGAITNGPVAANKVLTSALTTPDVGANMIGFDVTVTHTALASGGSVVLVDSSGSKQYRVRSLQLNQGGVGFSGGDRLGVVTDNSALYTTIPALTMQNLVNAQWGTTNLPNPVSAINTLTAAGADLVFKYSGGAVDYNAGSLVISGLVQRIV